MSILIFQFIPPLPYPLVTVSLLFFFLTSVTLFLFCRQVQRYFYSCSYNLFPRSLMLLCRRDTSEPQRSLAPMTSRVTLAKFHRLPQRQPSLRGCCLPKWWLTFKGVLSETCSQWLPWALSATPFFITEKLEFCYTSALLTSVLLQRTSLSKSEYLLKSLGML